MPASRMWCYSTDYWWHFTISQRQTTGFPKGDLHRGKHESGRFATSASGSRTEKKKWNGAMKNLSPYTSHCMSYSCAEIACGQETAACIMIPSLFLLSSFSLSPFSLSDKYTPLTKAAPKPYLFSMSEQKHCSFLILFLKFSWAQISSKADKDCWQSCSCWHLVSSTVPALILYIF